MKAIAQKVFFISFPHLTQNKTSLEQFYRLCKVGSWMLCKFKQDCYLYVSLCFYVLHKAWDEHYSIHKTHLVDIKLGGLLVYDPT